MERESSVNFPRMKEIFFAKEPWRVAGDGHFVGVFHLFKGGRDLHGDFTSPEARVNGMRFPELKGSLRWAPDRFDVTRAQSRFYGGGMRFEYALAPLGRGKHPSATFNATYEAVDLSSLGSAMEWPGIRVAGALSGQTKLEWPLGRFVDRRGSGDSIVTPPGRRRGAAANGAARARGRRGHASAPVGAVQQRPAHPGRRARRRRAALHARSRVDHRRALDDGDARGRSSSFEGRTAYGDRSTIPFHVTSADWEESDRVLAGIMTAFGSETTAVAVGGSGEFDGVMRLAFKHPRIEGRFQGDRMRAWDVTWGRATGDLVIEDSYVSLNNARVTNGSAHIETEGRFALGYPRKDGGEEINARIRATRWPLTELRHAFQLDDWPLDGTMSGEFHLYGKYQTP